ncbi:3-isopropylmalate dehydratase small subunit [Roseobacter sp. HKCCD9010]|uniref:3-isopropylmalate dehydratase small subunit n=1 Tax=unclassified Roseobacter TaxID=196798 RepID=UPI0014929D3B|nr:MULTISPECIES: 3-isopropylmalate dehydratase small subunit [unclassified Roseobacter]MBF9052083.1 3-isopropylmalate dehydratase small subunit [Rhodobacterales bacterium HKCCD4356]NNV14005.1 3-isopropylmalate dehydratase small subunit [Roseobacter sp. HKCCD7357]NNV18246.1 3-isopropylmalate dehydratase small subunit [Roseobacter sp. HKCCD8768]NNV27704.1 3-isopropylmalate dehydratase small subunit [Roseobacter sp. HKCCD8192]NNV31947.1 3-isopropylmalate dehydratase small subunit [Roseobacter sp.
MKGWTEHKGTAIALDIENVDTDQLIPARFMSTTRADGYGKYLFHDLRTDNEGAPDPHFPINRHPTASILVGRRNFGSGSSREAAVYALVDYGMRAVIAPSFGDIFASNSVNNSLLPALISEEDAAQLIALIGDGQVELNLNIETTRITVGGQNIPFTLSGAWAQKLMNGWDDIDLTEHHCPAISEYRARRARMLPWVFPAEETAG